MAKAVAALDAGNAEAQRDLGVAYYKLMIAHRVREDQAAWEAAGRSCVEQFERAFEMAPDDPRARRDLMSALGEYALGLLLGEQPEPGRLAEGLARAERLNALSGGADPAHLDILALACFLNGDAAKAAEVQRKALALVPEDEPEAAEMRERFEHQLQDYEAAARGGAIAIRGG